MIDLAKKKEEKDKDKEGGPAPLSERMIKNRVLLLSKVVDDAMLAEATAQLLLMQEEDEKKPITVYINSPGGSADSGFALFDLLNFISPPIVTICSGICASAAIMIYLGGDKKYRFSLPNSRFLLHQPSTSSQGSASDLQITAQEIIKIRERYNKIVSLETGQKVEKITADSSRDFWLSPTEAQEYGLVTQVITNRKEIEGLL